MAGQVGKDLPWLMASLTCAPHLGLLVEGVTQVNVTCVPCGCREGRERILELPGPTVHFLQCMWYQEAPVIFYLSILGAELSWAVNSRSPL